MLRYLGTAERAFEPQQDDAAPSFSAVNDSLTFYLAAEAPVTDRPVLNRNPLVSKLRSFVDLSRDDVALVERLCRSPRTYPADHNLIQEDARCGHICIVMSGLAFRYKMLRNGQRQILGYLIPGDICDLSFTLTDKPDFSVSLVAEFSIVKVPIPDLVETLERSRNLRRALELAAHQDSVIMRQWLVNIGQRKAHRKISHFLYEMSERFRIIGNCGVSGWIDFPLNQHMLADTIGTTPVHINRTLQRLRQEGVILLDRRRLRILDIEKLLSIADFEGNYLNSFDHPA